MAELVALADLQSFLKVDAGTDDTLLTNLTAQVKALLEADCGRSEAPFQDTQANRVEVKDGTGQPGLWLDYPLASVSEVLLGQDFTVPDETLATADPTVLLVTVGQRRLVRRDGGTFGETGEAGIVRVTYTTQADLPKVASLAVMRGVAAVYRQRGSEDAKTERIGGYETELAELLRSDGIWQEAVRTLQVIEL